MCECFLRNSLSLSVSLHPSLSLTPPPLSETKWPDGFQSYMLIHDTQTVAMTHLPQDYGSASHSFALKTHTSAPHETGAHLETVNTSPKRKLLWTMAA